MYWYYLKRNELNTVDSLLADTSVKRTPRVGHCLSLISFWLSIRHSLRKQPTFGDSTTGFPAKWRLRNEGKKSILMTRHYPDLGNAFYWLNQISHATRPIRSATQFWVMRHQYGISALVSQTSFGEETSGTVAKCRLFSQALYDRHLPKTETYYWSQTCPS